MLIFFGRLIFLARCPQDQLSNTGFFFFFYYLDGDFASNLNYLHEVLSNFTIGVCKPVYKDYILNLLLFLDGSSTREPKKMLKNSLKIAFSVFCSFHWSKPVFF